jgi:hypothetical protein
MCKTHIPSYERTIYKWRKTNRGVIIIRMSYQYRSKLFTPIFLVFILAVMLIVSSWVATPTVHADAYWTATLKAKAAVDAGNPAAALPYWELLLDHAVEISDWNSAALYSKKLAKYYDGIGQYEKAIDYYVRENQYWLNKGVNWGAEDMGRVDQIRSIAELYISSASPEKMKQLAAPSKGGLAKFEPESGVYLGLYAEGDPKMGNFYSRSEQIYDKKHAMYLVYGNWGGKFPTRQASLAKAAGAALQIGWQPSDGLDAVKDDAYVRQWARDAKASGIPIFLRFASEMNGDWTVWGGLGLKDKHIEKFRLISRIMKEEAPNVAMVWSPGDVPKFTMSSFYPGDEYVDWVGVSLYSEPYGNGDPAEKDSMGLSPVERLDEIYKLYADRKPIMISETGVAHLTHADNKSHSDWAVMNLDRLYSVMPKKYPRLKAITYFNTDNQGKPGPANDYLLRDDPQMFGMYKQLIADPHFLTRVEMGIKPEQAAAYTAMGGSTRFTEAARIVPYVKIKDIFISKVEFVLNGQVIASQTKAPYGIDLKAGQVPEGSTFALRVYDMNGKVAVQRNVWLSSEVSVRMDGLMYRFEQPPVIIDGNTLAPVRAIFEAMGATVEWDPATRTATGKKAGTTVSFTIGDKLAKKNGQPLNLEVPAQLVNSTTMVPARIVGETFGGKVDWNSDSRTVNIASGK